MANFETLAKFAELKKRLRAQTGSDEVYYDSLGGVKSNQLSPAEAESALVELQYRFDEREAIQLEAREAFK